MNQHIYQNYQLFPNQTFVFFPGNMIRQEYFPGSHAGEHINRRIVAGRGGRSWWCSLFLVCEILWARKNQLF